jgi:outer membrane protein assembly factor BamB
MNEEQTATKSQSAAWNLWYQLSRRLAVLAACFTAIVAVLLTATFIQITIHDPLESPALEALRERLAENSRDDVIRQGIRTLDLQARRAYFSTQSQVQSGTLLMLLGAAVLFGALRVQAVAERKLLRPSSPPGGAGEWAAGLSARRAVAGGGLALFALALLSSVAVQSALRKEILAELRGTQPEIGKETPASFPSTEEMRRNWPAFRGPGSLSCASVGKAPTDWDGKTGRGIAWKVKVPRLGFSSAIAWGEQVFVTGADETARDVFCYNLADGNLLWTQSMPELPESPAELPEVTEDTGLAAPTMATDGTRAFAMFATGDLLCVDLEGKVVWAKNLGVPENHYGHSSSLLTHEDLLLVQYDHGKDARVMALKVGDGQVAWERKRKVEVCWASPILANTGNRLELILTANPLVVSYDPRTGEELWQVECMGGEVGPSATYADGMVFVANEYVKMVGIRTADASIAWESEEYLPNCASPLAADKYVFVATSDGILACYDAAKGTVLWDQEYDEGFYGSPVVVGDLLYVVDLEGTTRIVKVDAKHTAVASPALGEPSTCTPAFVGDKILMRGAEHLYCISGSAGQ